MKALWVDPTDRQNQTGTAKSFRIHSTRRLGTAYGRLTSRS
ncbi:hypothetical protein [Methylacidimicrobium sp. AP8]|nr:hypothetical protein [Methylacidimicrobium sp. AP8]